MIEYLIKVATFVAGCFAVFIAVLSHLIASCFRLLTRVEK